MKRTLLLALCSLVFALIAGKISAQMSTYTVSQIPYNPDPFTQGTVLNGVAIDDIYSAVVPLPFSVCFFDSSFSSIVIGTNGVVSFDLSLASGYCAWPAGNPIPHAAYDSYTIMAPFQDIDPSVGGTIRTAVAGIAPYRRFIISYYQIPMFNCTSMLFSEQVILYETTNIIEVHIEDKPLCTAWNGGAAILGIQYNGSLAYAAPNRNFPTQWAAVQESWRFTPSLPCGNPLPVLNTVSGKSYSDLNNNCIFDPGTDYAIVSRPISISSGAYYAWTDLSGNYSVALDTGNWIVEQQALGPYFAAGCPASGNYAVNFSSFGQSFTADFADSLTAICPDLWVDIAVVNMSRCRTEVVYGTYCNLGSIPDSNVVVTVTLPDSITLDSASLPYQSLPNNTFNFPVGSLQPNQCGTFHLFISVGCDSVGTVYCMMADIAGQILPECDTNNLVSECNALIASYDPNDKRVASQNQQGYVTEDTIGPNDRLSYMIRFQNTGSDTAFRVVILDTISPLLDIETVVLGSSSHNYQWTRSGNVVRIEFDNIMLPDSGTDFNGSIGFVKLHVDQLPGNQPGTVIENSASIYFDGNPPILTNTTVNTIPLVVVGVEHAMESFQLFPNPGHEQVTLVWDGLPGDEWVLLNLQGQEVLRQNLGDHRTVISTSALPNGLYLYQVRREGRRVVTGKWLKM